MATPTTPLDADKLSLEIFSFLESQFLSAAPKNSGKVRILSVDGGQDALLAAVALFRLETTLRKLSGDDTATISDFFDLAAGSGAGAVLISMLFTKPKSMDRKTLFSAGEALRFLSDDRNVRSVLSPRRWWQRGTELSRVFGGVTMRDTVKAVVVPCCDLATRAPFVFSRADAVEMEGCDFRMGDVCVATCAERAVGIRSVDGGIRTVKAVAGEVVGMGNPTAVAVTHVLNNKHEFPFADGVEDLLVLSIGSVGGECGGRWSIAGAGATDMVDQAVAMAFGQSRASNYVRIQANSFGGVSSTAKDARKKIGAMEDILSQRNVESVMFRGKKISDETNGEKLERFAGELIKENERRKKSLIPTVMLKQVMTPRTSSARTSTITTATTPSTRSSSSSSLSPSH